MGLALGRVVLSDIGQPEPVQVGCVERPTVPVIAQKWPRFSVQATLLGVQRPDPLLRAQPEATATWLESVHRARVHNERQFTRRASACTNQSIKPAAASEQAATRTVFLARQMEVISPPTDVNRIVVPQTGLTRFTRHPVDASSSGGVKSPLPERGWPRCFGAVAPPPFHLPVSCIAPQVGSSVE